MKILDTTICGSNRELLKAVVDDLELLTSKHPTSIENGWHAIISMHRNGEAKPYFRADMQADQGGGNFAIAKQRTLEQFSDLSATGTEDLAAFRNRLERYFDNLSGQRKALFKSILDEMYRFDHIEQMSSIVINALRDYGLTAYLGAIRVPYRDRTITESGAFDSNDGTIDIVFSGEKAWKFLIFCGFMLDNLQRALKRLWKYDSVTLQLDDLKKDQQCGMVLSLIGIEET